MKGTIKGIYSEGFYSDILSAAEKTGVILIWKDRFTSVSVRANTREQFEDFRKILYSEK